MVLIIASLLTATPDYAAHIAAQKVKYGNAAKDLVAIVEAPFVVWGDAGELQVQRSAEHTVRWAVQHIEKQFFSKRPAGIFDIFLFKDAESYRRHAKAMWNDEPSTPYGYASSVNRVLVMDISTGGGTLVHEMVHPYVDANFSNPPTWINEGLASLFEQSAERDDEMVGLTNWRLAGLNEAFKNKKVKRFADLVSGTDAQFRDEDEDVQYAQARYLMLYLQERGLLKTFVKKALEQQKKDPTGATALRETLGAAEWKLLDDSFKRWVTTLHFP
jgi:hypothetical protein